MKRRTLLSIGGSALAQTPTPGRSSGATTRKPKNVLFLLSDQHQRAASGFAGHPVAKTPNLDRLAASGVTFANAYCTNPVCTPSRASIFTGLYTHHHDSWNNSVPWPFEHQTMAHHFSRAGYMSAVIGKMHNVDAQTHGFDYRMDFNDWYQQLGPKIRLYAEELDRPNGGSGLPQIPALWRDCGDPWQGTRTPDQRRGLVHVGRVSKLAERDHFESFVTRESIRFLREHGRKRPFFLVSSFLKPHDPYMPAERFAQMFRPADMRLPESWGKVDLSTVPKDIRQRIELHTPTPELKDPEMGRIRMAMYYANVAQMDDCVGQMLAALKELDLEDDTIVVYTSDHGEMLGEHGLWQKFVFYEPSVGVPLVVRVPGLTPSGASCDNITSQVQLMPTLLDLCGLPPARDLDGESLTPDLKEPSRTRSRVVYAEFGSPRSPRYMIRRGDLKYSYYVNDTPELYNLKSDPGEMHNRAGLPEHRKETEALKAELFAWRRPPGV